MIWRDPPELSDDLYPGLSVWDARVSGSITIKDSRLPLWAIMWAALVNGWDDVEYGWSPTEHYDYTEDDLGHFLADLLEMRGEFGRLLLLLANAERLEREGEEVHFSELAPATAGDEINIFDMSLTPGDGKTPWPESWWENPDITEPIVEQLKRCIEVLEKP